MIWFTFVFFLIILAVYYCENKRMYRHLFSTLLFAILLGLIMGGNFYNADTNIYQITYAESKNFFNVGGSQWAFSLFGWICNSFNFSFSLFRLIFYFVGIILLYIFSIRTLYNPFPFFIVYMFFPMIIDATQMKNFMAMVIMLNAIVFLNKISFKNILAFLILMIISAGFQITAFIYLPLLFFVPLFKKNIRIAVFSCSLVAFLFITDVGSEFLRNIILSVVQGELRERVIKFFAPGLVNYGYFVYIIATIFCLLICYWCNKVIHKNKISLTGYYKYLNMYFSIFVYIILFMPFYKYAQDFSRFLRNLIPLLSVCVILSFNSKLIKLNEKNVKFSLFNTKYKPIEIITFMAFFVFIIYEFRWDIGVYWNTVVTPFFNYNLFF